MREIKTYDKKKVKPNFELTIKASPGIPDCAYIIEYKSGSVTGSDVLVAELPLDQNRSCTYTAYLDSIILARVTAIFPDGTVCKSNDVLPLVPGEKVEIDVYHAFWQVSGGKSSFYRDWTNAKDAWENIRRRTNLPYEKADSLRLDYLKQHIGQLGCLYYFDSHSGLEDVEELPAAIMQTQFGRKWAAGAPSRAEAKARRLATAKNPLWVFKDPQGESVHDELYDLYQSYIDGGAYVLDKEYSGDDPKNPYLRGYYGQNAKNGVKVYRLADKALMKSIKKEYYKKLKLD